MSPTTYYDLESLIAAAETQLDQFDVVSLDIFDTLFIRRIPDPNMVKIPVAQFIADEAKRLGIQVTPLGVRQKRNEIENAHRALNGKTNPDHEARYDDFMAETLAAIFGDQLKPDLLNRVADYEIRMESAMIVAREQLVRWIKTLAERGKRVFLISDIYLPSKYLKWLVKDKGLSQYVEEVISSADNFRAKASGATFPLLEKRYGIDRQRWMHVGDNPISDGARPAEFGITSLVIHDIGEHHRLSLATRYNFYASQRDFWKGRNLYQWMMPLEEENQDRDPLYNDGFGFFGYLLCNFIHRLIERCKDEDIQRVYFCSREGWMFKQIWDELVPWFYPHGDAPEASYLYVSRMGLASAACGNVGLTPVDAQVARFPAGNRDFRDICRIFKLDAEALAPFLDRHGLSIDDPIGANAADFSLEAATKFPMVLDDPEFQAAVKKQTSAPNRAFQAYLESERFFESDRVALVDIGWLGTIQHYLAEAIDGRQDTPHIFGFVLGAIRLVPYQSDFKISLEGLISDVFRTSFYSAMTNTIKPVLEEICRAPHPTLVGYEQEANGEPRLVFRHTDDAIGQDEVEQSKYYRPLHEGIIDCARRYGPAAQIYQYNTGELKPWLNFMYLSKVAFPKTKEILRVRHQSHQDDFFGKHKPSKNAIKNDETLWTLSKAKLRYNPFVRLYWYLVHTSRFLGQ